ncbi:hypothetical protein BKE30_08685 [Alkanindiges hydrocarboniclasticus]|jgi:multiple antibiotic resistance protein|uniref:UPF0056 membrane protein n=1 Tax=Alkanindiges hydrocarboniclasticus TaxID=1907941 RepID=A0A1S8CU80_9GAMM|nr:MarC family protein [Alkanindiges hydrocarboniclasticus]ONG39838.1 hypothetical protein BKE30_08685 [Alkanindiges hydrocarboniclasticus]
MSEQFFTSFALFFSLLNPFLMSIYLLGMIRQLSLAQFSKVLVQGALISSVVFLLFSYGGEAIFNRFLHVRFESFQIFGGIIFLIIGVRYVFEGADTLESTRGKPEYLAGSVAMPFMIGPGTISASVVIGSSLSIAGAATVIAATMVLTCSMLILFKYIHDNLKARYARYVDRYIEIVGRLSALLIGTIAVDMIVTGVMGLM